MMRDKNVASSSRKSGKGDKLDGRLVVSVEKDKFYLVTNCLECNMMRCIDDRVAYVLPDNVPVERVLPHLENLVKGGRIILKEVTNCEALNKEKLMASFYNNGQLINNKFSNVGLTPDIFAEAGMKLSANEQYGDRVICALNEAHALANWELSDRPVTQHIQHFDALPCRGLIEFFRINVLILIKV